ncbi:hypothetical protein F0U60_34410 [Archangium minus]|uniref:Lipoprotein n=1 Tax=Archangium minus TaxID=83450 RepID=A0ABY9WZR5_9BACT|nr:hypothetical protein F0U60_34410 [Archangium minus]
MNIRILPLLLALVASGCAGSTHSRLTGVHPSSTSNVEAHPVDHLAIRSLIERFLDATNSDQLVKQDGQRRFARHTFHLRYEDDVAVPERLLGITAPSLSGR